MHKMSYWFIAIYLTVFAVLLILQLKTVEFENNMSVCFELEIFSRLFKFYRMLIQNGGLHRLFPEVRILMFGLLLLSYFTSDFNRGCCRLLGLIRAARVE